MWVRNQRSLELHQQSNKQLKVLDRKCSGSEIFAPIQLLNILRGLVQLHFTLDLSLEGIWQWSWPPRNTKSHLGLQA
jgi:hypothetical protein